MEVIAAQQISAEQHPDFLWTWKSNKKGTKTSVWLPYFSDVQKIPRTKKWKVSYNGGEIDLDLDKIDLLMFYGASGSIPLEFLDHAARNKVVILLHRRNIPDPYVFYPPVCSSEEDLLSNQIRVRSHDQKRTYIAKVFIRERFSRMKETVPIPLSLTKRLAAAKSVGEVRSIEAFTTARYWEKWYGILDVDSSRRSTHPITSALDAGSKFLFGVILRWLVFHKFSPNHGYLHEPTSYPSLVYDLMEPYRYLIEAAVAKAWEKSDQTEKSLIALTISILKDDLEELCFVPATRQYVRRKNLLHGVVLALRSYLTGEMKRLVIPTEGVPNGGRPPKVGYKLPGSVYDCNRKKPVLKKEVEEREGSF